MPPGAILTRLRTRARRVIDRPPEELSPLSRAGVLTLHLLVSCIRKLRRDRAPQMASALAFQTLFSLLPLLVLVLLVLNSVRGLEGAGTTLRAMVADALVPESLIEADSDLVGPPDPNAPATVEEFNDAREVLRLRMDKVVEALSSVSFAGIGVAGFLLFLYGATALLGTVESSFNLLYQADDPPPWSRLPLYFTLLTLGPLALVGAQILQDRLILGLETFVGRWLAAAVGWLAPLLVSCLVLALAYRTIPNAWVSWRAAMAGGLWSGLAWFTFQEIFGFYVDHVSMVNLYGALALVPLFLLWVYWSWFIILAGLAFSFIVQYLAADEHWVRRVLLPADPRWLLPVMVLVAEAFARGEKMTNARLSLELAVPPRLLSPYLRVLERQGYLRVLRDRDDQHILTLTRPAAEIQVREILELGPSVRAAVTRDLFDDLRRCELEAAEGISLAEMVGRLDPARARGLALAPAGAPVDQEVERPAGA